MKRPGMRRRELLARLGVSAAVAPFIPELEAWAAPASPRRLILFFQPSGVIENQFWPTGSETGFALSPALEALAPHRADLLVIKGLQQRLQGPGGSHERAIAGLWTAARLNAGTFNATRPAGWCSAPSVDQIIARRLPRETPFATLDLGVQPFGPGPNLPNLMHSIYAGSDQPVPSEGNPYKVLDRVFGQAAQLVGVSQDQLRVERRSVIDVIVSELAELRSVLGRADWQKVDAHVTSLRAIERRLQGTDAKASCVARAASGQIDVNANDNFPALAKLQIDLLVSALACDRTRIATLQLGRASGDTKFNWIEKGVYDGYHGMTHFSAFPADRQEQAKRVLPQIDRWHMQQLAYLVSELKKVPAGNGTLFDGTLVVYGNEMASGVAHRADPVPTLLLGKLGGIVRTGRFIDYGGAFTATEGGGGTSPYHQSQLLVTICRAMGVADVNQVGNLGPPGPLPNVLA